MRVYFQLWFSCSLCDAQPVAGLGIDKVNSVGFPTRGWVGFGTANSAGCSARGRAGDRQGQFLAFFKHPPSPSPLKGLHLSLYSLSSGEGKIDSGQNPPSIKILVWLSSFRPFGIRHVFLMQQAAISYCYAFSAPAEKNFVTFSKVIKEQDKKTLSCSILDLTFTIGQNVK